MTTPAINEYGLLLERRNNYGTEYVVARVISKRDGRPYGCSSDGERTYGGSPKHLEGLQLDGLCLHGFISDHGENDYIGYEPEYRDVYSVELPKAERMAKTLKRVVSRQRKDNAREPGDALMSLANTLKLTFVVKRIGTAKGGWDSDTDWNFMSVSEGRNEYRRLIEEARAEVRQKLGKAA